MSGGDFHQICFISEILVRSRCTSSLVRVVGKLRNYSPITALGEIVDTESKTAHKLFVDFKNTREIPLFKGSFYQISGQLDGNTLIAHTVKNVDGIDIHMYKEAVILRLNTYNIVKIRNKFFNNMPKVLKQATISSLKGVVVVEDFQRHKNVLENSAESKEVILRTLSYLKKKKPCKEIILSIGIGETLQNLKKHSDVDIAFTAKDLCKYWEFESDKKPQPTIEVRYDNLTRHIRRNALKFFTEALGGSEEDEEIADILEKEIFHQNKRLISKSYRRTVRKVVFTLRYKENERNSLKNGTVTQVQFVKKYMQ